MTDSPLPSDIHYREMVEQALKYLREIYDKQIHGLEDRLKTFESSHQREHELLRLNTDRVAEAINEKFADANKWREENISRTAELQTKEGYEKEHSALVDRVNKIENWQSKIVGVGIVMMFLAGIAGAFIERAIVR